MFNKEKQFKNFTTGEDVQLENWCWKAIYTPTEDAVTKFQEETKESKRVVSNIECEILHQFDPETGIHHNIGEIDKSRLFVFVLFKLNDPLKRYEFIIRPGMKIFLKYRTTFIAWLDKEIRCPLIGYSKGKNQHNMLILPDDRVLVSSEDNFDIPNLMLHNY